MKKLLSLILVLAMVLTLCACGTADVGQNTEGSTEGSSVNTTENNIPFTSEETTEQSTESTEKKPSRLPTENLYQEFPASCEHGFSDATCTKPKTCDICSFELGDPLGHDFADGICTRCGAAEGAQDEVAE